MTETGRVGGSSVIRMPAASLPSRNASEAKPRSLENVELDPNSISRSHGRPFPSGDLERAPMEVRWSKEVRLRSVVVDEMDGLSSEGRRDGLRCASVLLSPVSGLPSYDEEAGRP